MLCIQCLIEEVVPPHRSYCSVRCMRAWCRTKRRQHYEQAREVIALSGYTVSERALFERAGKELLASDHRAWHYRLILDLVDGKWSRTPIGQGVENARSCRSVVFPEPNRRTHMDTNGLRRPGDFFTLRTPFEWPLVPVAAYYRVQLLGVCDKGEPGELQPLREGTTTIRVRLPGSPFQGRWRYSSWGSADAAPHRQRQAEKRAEQKRLAQELAATTSTPERDR